MAEIVIGADGMLTEDQYNLMLSTIMGDGRAAAGEGLQPVSGLWRLAISNGSEADMFTLYAIEANPVGISCILFDETSQVLLLRPGEYVISRRMYVCLPEWTITLINMGATEEARMSPPVLMLRH
jgi:hypothetical protein